MDRAVVSLVKTDDRAQGVATAIDLLKMNSLQGRRVLIKPNFNTADPFPGSTHVDTLRHLILKVRSMGAREIAVGDRSGPADTGSVIRLMGVDGLCGELEAALLNFDDLGEQDWVRIRPAGAHWRDGFDVARPVLESECLVMTCCLKTHGFGGVFTMSLKLSVGATHRRNMAELHSSVSDMRKMIAEINLAFTPALIVLDGIEAFVSGGPMRGRRAHAGVILAGTDRVAVDAAGLAVLKDLGSSKEIMGRKIFEQEQIARAVELGLGVSRPDLIDLRAEDGASIACAERLTGILRNE